MYRLTPVKTMPLPMHPSDAVGINEVPPNCLCHGDAIVGVKNLICVEKYKNSSRQLAFSFETGLYSDYNG